MSTINCLTDEYKQQLAKDVRQGLGSEPKKLSSKYFYDNRGSSLFEEICLLPEYYLTRCELEALHQLAPEIMKDLSEVDLIELGSGANWKIKVFLEAAAKKNRPTIRYVPVDVCGDYLQTSAQELLEIFPDISVLGIIADFTKHMQALPNSRQRLIFFLGSTLGNFTDEDALSFLSSVARNMHRDDHLLLGLDMLKSVEVMEKAYNDSLGITAAFNKNILQVINNELNADFDLELFQHLAFFNSQKGRVEMHLRAIQDMVVYLANLSLQVPFKKGETIHTEISRKFSPEAIEAMTGRAGLCINRWVTDGKNMFSLLDLVKKPS